MKLDQADRRLAMELEDWVIQNPTDASYEIVGLRKAIVRLEQELQEFQMAAESYEKLLVDEREKAKVTRLEDGGAMGTHHVR